MSTPNKSTTPPTTHDTQYVEAVKKTFGNLLVPIYGSFSCIIAIILSIIMIFTYTRKNECDSKTTIVKI